MSSGKNNKIRHYVRIRPTGNFASDSISFAKKAGIGNPKDTRKSIHIKKQRNHSDRNTSYGFTVDDLFYNSEQEYIYEQTTSPVVRNALDGISGSVIAYGEEKSGKTFTISGARDKRDFNQRGLIPRALGEIFQSSKEYATKTINISISYTEVSDFGLNDLIKPKNKLSKVFDDEEFEGYSKIQNLTVKDVNTEKDALKLFFTSEINRSAENSAIFSIYIKTKDLSISGGNHTKSILRFIDLSSWGHSSYAKTFAGQNHKSLSFVEQVLLAIQQKNNIPWRSNLLTHVLKGSFTTGTVLISTIHGEEAFIQGSIQTLKFANRVNCFEIEELQYKDVSAERKVKDLSEEVEKLKTELKMKHILDTKADNYVKVGNYEQLTDVEIESMEKHVNAFLRNEIESLDITSFRELQQTLKIFRTLYHQQATKVEQELKQVYSFTSRDLLAEKRPSFTTAKMSDQKSVLSDKKSIKSKKSKKSELSKTSIQASSMNVSSQNSHITPGSPKKIEPEIILTPDQKFDEFKHENKNYMKILELKKRLIKTQRDVKIQADGVNETVDIINLYEERIPDNLRFLSDDQFSVRTKLADQKMSYIEQKKQLTRLMYEEEAIKEEITKYRTDLLISFKKKHPEASFNVLPATTSTVALPRHPPFKI